MDYETLRNSMTVQDAARVLRDTKCYGTMDIAKSVILRALEQEPCEKCCNGNQEEKAKLCQKSYIAGMEHNCENEEIIKVSKGTLRARTGKYVVYDVEWLKEHFNTTEAKIYGQPKTGHWIEHKSNGMSYIECPKCSSWFLRIHLTRNSYCPNCGNYNGGTKK